MNFLNNVILWVASLIGRLGSFLIYILSKVIEMLAGAGAEAGKNAKDKLANRFNQAMEDADDDYNGPLR